MPKKPALSVSTVPLSVAVRSWKLSLQARNLSARTIEQYVESLGLFVSFTNDKDLAAVTTQDVQSFLADQLGRLKPSSVLTRYKGLRLFFGWAVDEEELEASPMTKVRPPIVPEQPVPVLLDCNVRTLLKACAGKDFESRRNLAILSVLFDTGIRRAECASLTVDDLDLERRCLRVLGKGRSVRLVPFGAQTAKALDRWLRVRGNANTDALWLSARGRGPLTSNAIRLMLDRLSRETGVELHAHLFRHTFAHNHLNNGGNEGDLMMLAGWKSRQMLNRYASSTAAERARNAYRSPLDML